MKGMASENAESAVKTLEATEGTWEDLDGQLKMFSRTLKVVTDSRVELYNVTDRVRDLVKNSGVKAGFLIISTLHTTTALFMNEFQAALMADVKNFLERLANRSQSEQSSQLCR